MNANFLLSRAWRALGRRGIGAMAAALFALALSGPAQAAPFAYITNFIGGVSVLDTASNTVVATVPVGSDPHGVAVTPDGAFVYITNRGSNTVSVIASASNTVVATVPVGNNPRGVAVTPDGAFVYVANGFSHTVSVIASATNTVLATVPVGNFPTGVAVTPDGARVYVANSGSGSVSVIRTANNTVDATVGVGINPSFPNGVAVTPDGAFVYVVNLFNHNVSVIRTADNMVVATVGVGNFPIGVAVTPDGAFVYVTNGNPPYGVSVIASATNMLVTTVPVGGSPYGVAVTPDGAFVYVAQQGNSSVSVIASASNTVVATVPVGVGPAAFGRFIGPTFPFSGFFSPVDNPPTLNAMKAGAAVPVKFSLGGARGLGVIAANFPQSKPVACPGGGVPVDVVELTLTAGNSSLSYDVATDTYTYAWKTDKAWAGSCRELTVRLSDGSNHKSLFLFK